MNELQNERLDEGRRVLCVCGGSEDGRTAEWPSVPPLFMTMFTLLSTLMCFHNLSSQNSHRKSYLAGVHNPTVHTHTHTATSVHGGSRASDNNQRDRVSRDEVRAVMSTAHRRQDEGSLVMGVKHEVLIRSHCTPGRCSDLLLFSHCSQC